MTASDLLLQQRRAILPLLNEVNPADAVASYYALHHDPRRTKLFTTHNARGDVTGFLALCQTGLDLFRPLVVLYAETPEAVRTLALEALIPGRPYILLIPLALRPWLTPTLTFADASVHRIYTLDTQAFRPVINVHVQSEPTQDGANRWAIRSNDGTPVALAGLNWRSPRWAEIYVQVDARLRGRGLGRSVVSACTSWVIDQRLAPLYLAAEENLASLSLAEALGYRDCRARLVLGQAMLGA